MKNLSPSVSTLPYHNPVRLDRLCVAGGFFMEEFRDVIGYEGLYQISSYGRVKSLDRIINDSKNNKKLIRGKILTPQKGLNNYMNIGLSKHKRCKRLYIHRLVAQAFIVNYNNKYEVNHIDGDKQNNKVQNLEWCTRSENHIHAYKLKLKTPVMAHLGKFGVAHNRSKPVIQMNNDGTFISLFYGQSEAQRITGVNQGNISLACLGIYKTAGGFKWKFATKF